MDKMGKKAVLWLGTAALAAMIFAGCGGSGVGEADGSAVLDGSGPDGREDLPGKGILQETAEDGHVDFEALQAENPDIFAWLYIPGTDIDTPVLQSPVSDAYYKTHGADGGEDSGGALFTEMPNLMDMCDFNTIIHGRDEEGGLFEDLHLFENPDFFEGHEKFYIYLPDNVLTYEIFAAYYDEGSDILRRYDYTTYEGCENYLKQVFGAREMGKNQREGWDDLTPYHYLVTLDGSVKEGSQYVVCGVLIGDAAGTIDRVILDLQE